MLFLAVLSSNFIFAQSEQSLIKNQAINVFVDFQNVDLNFLKENLQFANIVRARQYADVHILFTRQRTGGQGNEYTLIFIGKNKFPGMRDTLRYFVNKTDTKDSKRDKMLKTIKLGLIRFVAKTPLAKDIKISFNAQRDANGLNVADVDKWNYWVYKIKLRSFLTGQRSTKFINFRGMLSAGRVTKDWKFRILIGGSYNESNFKFQKSTITNITRSQYFSTYLVKSLSKHWSLGAWLGAWSSTYKNINIRTSFTPGIEYNFFPYSESNSRQLRFDYKIGGNFNNYAEETIYYKTREFLWEQKIEFTLVLIQPWGNVSTTLDASNYLHDFSKNSFKISGNLSINLIKGLSLDLSGSYQAVHNQLSLPLSSVNLEEVLLQRRELATQYQYYGSIGFTYTFGSIYNNIVNPRFGN